MIAFRPDESAHPLSQFQDRFRERVFRESIATLCFDAFQFCFNQRMIRHGERQPRDNDIAQRVTRNINPTPETVGPKKYAAWRILKLLEQFRPRHGSGRQAGG